MNFMIKAVAFDYGGVIEITESLIPKIVDALKVTKEDWLNTYYTLNHLNNVGGKSRLEVFTLTAKKLGASDIQIAHIPEILKENDQTRKINLELIEIIKDLKKQNYKIGLISNYSIHLRQKLIDKNIIDLFDTVIISGEVGYQKPQPEIFEILFQKLGVKNNETIFVDDTKQSLLGAESVGYLPLLYINNREFKEELNKIISRNDNGIINLSS